MTTTTTDVPKDLTGRPAKHDGAVRGKRISWAELWKDRPDLRPANDNVSEVATESAKARPRPWVGLR